MWVVARDHEDGHGYEDEDEDDVCVFPSVSFWLGGCWLDVDFGCGKSVRGKSFSKRQAPHGVSCLWERGTMSCTSSLLDPTSAKVGEVGELS